MKARASIRDLLTKTNCRVQESRIASSSFLSITGLLLPQPKGQCRCGGLSFIDYRQNTRMFGAAAMEMPLNGAPKAEETPVSEGKTSVSEEEPAQALPLPAAFVDFLKNNGLDPSIYAATHTLPRYVRLKPRHESQIPNIENDLGFQLQVVSWLPGFYSIPQQAQIASSEAYRQGKIYGMDAASGAAVLALDISVGEHILDLCAAPGAKLCMLADLLGNSGSLTGIDIAKHRLAACRTMLQKYGLGDRCRLFVADGTSIFLLPVRKPHGLQDSNGHRIDGKYLHTAKASMANCSQPSDLQALSYANLGLHGDLNSVDIFGEWTSRRTCKERRNARKVNYLNSLKKSLPPMEPELIFYGNGSGIVGLRKAALFQSGSELEASEAGYDKVLVDAECTHDGSIKHVCKFEQWGWDTLERRVLDAERISSITHLQLQLLMNGFRLLKTGGTLVYSTCSLTTSQNEDVVEQFLSMNPYAELREIEAAKHWPCKSGGIRHTLRFDPFTSKTGGLFIAKIAKLTL